MYCVFWKFDQESESRTLIEDTIASIRFQLHGNLTKITQVDYHCIIASLHANNFQLEILIFIARSFYFFPCSVQLKFDEFDQDCLSGLSLTSLALKPDNSAGGCA